MAPRNQHDVETIALSAPHRAIRSSVVVNYPWERAQSRLYVMPDRVEVEWWMCATASVADGLMVLLIFWIGKLVIGRRDWYLQPGVRGYAVLLLSGAVISVLVEGAPSMQRIGGTTAHTCLSFQG